MSAMYRGTVSDMSSNQNAAIAECASQTLGQDQIKKIPRWRGESDTILACQHRHITTTTTIEDVSEVGDLSVAAA